MKKILLALCLGASVVMLSGCTAIGPVGYLTATHYEKTDLTAQRERAFQLREYGALHSNDTERALIQYRLVLGPVIVDPAAVWQNHFGAMTTATAADAGLYGLAAWLIRNGLDNRNLLTGTSNTHPNLTVIQPAPIPTSQTSSGRDSFVIQNNSAPVTITATGGANGGNGP